jgi:formylglycine-generating enzyme required for sulfatase activity
MVAVGDAGYCIDGTEVTIRQYNEFLMAAEADAAAVAQPAECSWNTDVAVKIRGLCTPSHVDLSTRPDDPITCVNWCDAYAFCAWAGKRLCGKVGGGSLQVAPVNEVFDPQQAQWFAACTDFGAYTFPYGATSANQYVRGACNTQDVDGGDIVAVASEPQCVGPYPNLYDMVGNVAEWLDACQLSGSEHVADPCYEGGDSYFARAGGPGRCDNHNSDSRDYADVFVGIRCCSP